MLEIKLLGKRLLTIESKHYLEKEIKEIISKHLHCGKEDFYLLCNGKIYNSDVSNGIVHVMPRLCGGKGGFGSMLRAIGAQIEKTTNREACRDLSGRRLRDINEEKRLKNWIDQQAEREQEASDRRQRKLERLCQKPRHEFKDDTYDKERSELPERLEDAITQGLATSSNGKRKMEPVNAVKKKKKALWIDDDMEDLSSGDSSSDDENASKSDNSASSSSVNKVVQTASLDVHRTNTDAKVDSVLDEVDSKQVETSKQEYNQENIAVKTV